MNKTDENNKRYVKKIGVRFNLLRNVFIPIFNEMEWFDEYRIARRGNWVNDARRFKDRVDRFEKIFIPKGRE